MTTGTRKTRRPPAAFDPSDPDLHNEPGDNAEMPLDETANHTDARDENAIEPDANTKSDPPRRSLLGWGGLLVSTLIGLTMLSLSIWFARFTSVALTRNDWLGWTAQGLIALAAFAAAVLIIREIVGLFRLSRLTRLRKDTEHALASKTKKHEQAVVRRLKSQFSGREHRWDLQRFRDKERHMQEPGELIGLADCVLLAGPDREARSVIYQSARRTAVVTAVVPIAFIVVLFVLFENLRMIRRIAGAYEGRPGFFGGVRLFWWIVAHIAATGAIALTDDLWGQFLGQDVARRLSRRLGEGAFNGAMTARLGIAALRVCRPLPYINAKPPRLRSILAELFPDLKAADLMPAKLRGRGKNQSA